MRLKHKKKTPEQVCWSFLEENFTFVQLFVQPSFLPSLQELSCPLK